MRPFRLQPGLERAASGDFAWPLGVEPSSVESIVPREGYVVGYHAGKEDEPDTYSFSAIVSHEKLGPLAKRAFELLGNDVGGIVEIGSRDAYRSLDTFLSDGVIHKGEFLQGWHQFERFLLDDVSIGAGAYQDEPYLEVFIDPLKTLNINTSMSNRDVVEQLLRRSGLVELDDFDPTELEAVEVRPILELRDERSPDLDDLLLELQDAWMLELDVDPDQNVDEGGRRLGKTLWNVVAIVFRENSESDDQSNLSSTEELRSQRAHADSPAAQGSELEQGDDEVAYASFWLTASSLREAERLVANAIETSGWHLETLCSFDRIAFDERPDELADLALRRDRSVVHLMRVEQSDEETLRSESEGGNES